MTDPKKTDRRIKKTKTAIQEAFVKLLEKKDPADITVTELAQTANIDRKTFYIHYDTISGIIQEFESEMRTKLEAILHESKPFSVGVFFERFTSLLQENLLLSNLIASKHSLSPIRNECKEIFKESLIASYGGSNKLKKEQFEVLAEYMAGGIMGIYIEWLSNGTRMSLEDLTVMTSDIVADDWKKLSGE